VETKVELPVLLVLEAELFLDLKIGVTISVDDGEFAGLED